jgi:hypothetical protein
MLTRGEDEEAHALSTRGWSISAIARHLARNRKTVRSYMNNQRTPGVRARSDVPYPPASCEKYVIARFADDHQVGGTVLFEELVTLGYDHRASRRSSARCATVVCDHTARRARECRAATRPRLTIRRAKRSGGTGSSAGVLPGVAPPPSCTARCPTPAGYEGCWPCRWTMPTSSRLWAG